MGVVGMGQSYEAVGMERQVEASTRRTYVYMPDTLRNLVPYWQIEVDL